MAERRSRRREEENAVLRFLAAWEDPDCGPSLRDLAEATSISLGGVHSVCTELKTKGLVRWKPRIARSLNLTDEGYERALEIPSE